MKAVVVNDNSTIKIEDIENPELGSNDILVKMAACGICGRKDLSSLLDVAQ